MKRLVLALAFIASLGLVAATAQNISRSVQLSQDPSGPIGFDTVNGTYFPGHVNSSASASPVASVCGTTPAVVGTDTAGEITEGTGSVTACNLTFARAYNATPYCTATSNATASPTSVAPSANGILFGHLASSASLKIYYMCIGSRTG